MVSRIVKNVSILICGAALFAASASATQIAVGYVSWDVNFPGNAGQFDITNLTGANAAPTTFPILTQVNLSSLSLTVTFVGGGMTTEPAGYFTLASDGESWNGTAIPIGGTNPLPTAATLTGLFSPTSINVSGMGVVSILNSFTVSFNDTPSLVDGDLGVIYATVGTTSTTPEPGTWMLMSLGLVGLISARGRRPFRGLKTILSGGTSLMSKCLLPVLCLVVAHSAFGQLVLPADTTPSSGVAGVNNVNITASDVPAGTYNPANVVVTFAATCGGAAVATEAANSIRTVLGSTDRINLNLPVSLATGTYFVQLSDSADPTHFTSTNCSAVQVTASTAILNACVAGSSMGVLLPANGAAGNVTAYVPKGFWESATTGVFVKNIEGTLGAATTIPTPNSPNSCSSNPATGQTVCVANNTDVYLISGTTLNTTLTSGSTGQAGFSGGSCNNCGVALNANNNTAVINMGLSGSPSGSGVQILNLTNNTFSTPFPTNLEVSENISVDPTRSLILTANEQAEYMLLQIQPNGSLLEFDPTFSSFVTDDSSAEDCSTGIAIAPGEFTNSLQLLNLNGVTFTTSPYTVPNSVVTLATTNYGFSAGLSGSAVAQGSGHLAVVTGEFGGNTFAVLKLPPTPTTATPALVDYAIAQIPASTACGGTFSAGFDPHTITAYTSPNGAGDAMAVFAGYSSGGIPICLAVVDMTTVINPTLSPRGTGGYGANEISPASLPAGAVTFYTLP